MTDFTPLPLALWADRNEPSDSMNWKGAYLAQIQRWLELEQAIGRQLRVVGTHRSKSIDLPVVEIKTSGGVILLRDNFYDINLHVDSARPVALNLSDLYPDLPWAEYLDAIEKCRGYTFRGWTDEEMSDPRIFRVWVTHDSAGGAGGGYWSEVSGQEKDRWTRRMESPDRYSRDWSAGSLLFEGDFGPDCRLFRAERVGGEGLPSADHYSPTNNKKFTAEVAAARLDSVLQTIMTEMEVPRG